MKIIKSIDKLSESRLTSVWEFAFAVRKAIEKIEKSWDDLGLPSKSEESFKKKYLIARGEEAVHASAGWITIYEHKFPLDEWNTINDSVIMFLIIYY